MQSIPNWTGVTKSLLTSPGEFYDGLPGENAVGGPLLFAAISSAILGSVAGFISVLLNIGDPAGAVLGFTLLFLLFSVVSYAAFLAESSIAHLILVLTGNRGLARTLEAFAYPTAVRTTLAWIPLVNIVVGFYGLYLQVKGVTALHETSTGTAVAAVLVAALLSWFLVFLGLVIVVAVLGAFLLSLGNEPAAALV